MTHVPFENISKLLYLQRDGIRNIPSLENYLNGIEQFNFGGTCYSNNSFFQQLLVGLGYDARLCGADMNNPDVHLVIRVLLDSREYLIDVGYAAPFDIPLPRDLHEDYVIRSGEDRYVLKPQDSGGRSRLEMYHDGVLKHGYIAKPEARSITEFSDVILDSFRYDSTFMNSILLTRFLEDRFIIIHNLTLTKTCGEVYEQRVLADRDELTQAVDELFGIPAHITAGVVQKLGSFGDAWE